MSPHHRIPCLFYSQPLIFTAPSAPPSSVRGLVNNSTTITVQWGTVEPCDKQNGYSVRYGEVGNSEEKRRVQMASGDSMTTVSGLTKETVYTVEVAAETSGGTGVYSEPLTIETPDSECVPLAVAKFMSGVIHIRNRCLPQSVKSSLIMAMWRSVILAPLISLLFSVILTDLLLVGNGLHQVEVQ